MPCSRALILSSISGPSFLRNHAIFCLLALFTCRPIGTFLVNPQLRSRKRAYDIVYSVMYSMPEPSRMISRRSSAVRYTVFFTFF